MPERGNRLKLSPPRFVTFDRGFLLGVVKLSVFTLSKRISLILRPNRPAEAAAEEEELLLGCI